MAKKRALSSTINEMETITPSTKKRRVQQVESEDFEVCHFNIKCVECNKQGTIDRKLWIIKQSTDEWIFCDDKDSNYILCCKNCHFAKQTINAMEKTISAHIDDDLNENDIDGITSTLFEDGTDLQQFVEIFESVEQSNLIKTCNIPQDINKEIAEYATGDWRICDCGEFVSILNEKEETEEGHYCECCMQTVWSRDCDICAKLWVSADDPTCYRCEYGHCLDCMVHCSICDEMHCKDCIGECCNS